MGWGDAPRRLSHAAMCAMNHSPHPGVVSEPLRTFGSWWAGRERPEISICADGGSGESWASTVQRAGFRPGAPSRTAPKPVIGERIVRFSRVNQASRYPAGMVGHLKLFKKQESNTQGIDRKQLTFLVSDLRSQIFCGPSSRLRPWLVPRLTEAPNA